MLRWAYGYLAVAVVVAIGFAVVQGTHRSERRVVIPATEQGATGAPGVSNDEAELDAESQPEDDTEFQDESDPEDDRANIRTRVSCKRTARRKIRANGKTRASGRTKAASKTKATSSTSSSPAQAATMWSRQWSTVRP